MAQDRINLPSGYGGLMKYSEEYSSRINLKPTHIIAFIVFVIILRILLPVFLG